MTRHFKTEADLILELIDTLEMQAEFLSTEEDELIYREWLHWLHNKYEDLPGE